MKRCAILLLIAALVLGLGCSRDKNPAGASTSLLPIDYMKNLADTWVEFWVTIAVYDTSTGTQTGGDQTKLLYRSLGSVPFGGETAIGEEISLWGVGIVDTMYWVADEDEAVLYNQVNDPIPEILIDTPLRDGHDWEENPNSTEENRRMATIMETDSSLILPGGIFNHLLCVRVEPKESDKSFYQVMDYFFHEGLSFIAVLGRTYTRSGKRMNQVLIELDRMGTGGYYYPPASARLSPLAQQVLNSYFKGFSGN